VIGRRVDRACTRCGHQGGHQGKAPSGEVSGKVDVVASQTGNVYRLLCNRKRPPYKELC